MRNRAALLATAAAAFFMAAHPASAQLSPDAKRVWSDYERLGPHKLFMLAPNGRGYSWGGASGEDPGGAIERGLKYCEARPRPSARCLP